MPPIVLHNVNYRHNWTEVGRRARLSTAGLILADSLPSTLHSAGLESLTTAASNCRGAFAEWRKKSAAILFQSGLIDSQRFRFGCIGLPGWRYQRQYLVADGSKNGDAIVHRKPLGMALETLTGLLR